MVQREGGTPELLPDGRPRGGCQLVLKDTVLEAVLVLLGDVARALGELEM